MSDDTPTPRPRRRERPIAPDAISWEAAKRIKDGLEALGMTQREAAAGVGKSDGTVSAWLGRHTPMPLTAVRYFAALLGITVGELLEPERDARSEGLSRRHPEVPEVDADVSGRVESSGARAVPPAVVRDWIVWHRRVLLMLEEHLAKLEGIVDGGASKTDTQQSGTGASGGTGATANGGHKHKEATLDQEQG